MVQASITSIGVYLPLLRLDRRAAGAALRWAGLGGGAGRRAVAAWDEDAFTLAVEAARAALPPGAPPPGELIFASTSAPFLERLHAGLLLDALHLPAALRAQDVGGSRRCAISALARALAAPAEGGTLIAAGERRAAQAGNPLHLAWGDGAAAVTVGAGGFARLLGAATSNHDFVDVFASRAHPTPYQTEERFIRDEAIESVLLPTIRAACAKAGIAPASLAAAVVPEPVAGTWKALAAALGTKAANASEAVQAGAGELGAAHALFGLALGLEAAQPGDKILLVGFGSGCDALVLDITAKPPASGAAAALAEGQAFADYVRFLSLTGALELDWGARSEHEQKTAPSVLNRYGRDMLGFIGGRDSLGNVQFPKTRIPVNPGIAGPETLEDVRLADSTARIVSVTADRLNFCPDPPFHFGLVQFPGGARVLMEFCDVAGRAPAVGDAVRMRLRIKSLDHRRGFCTWFWKAAPVARPALEN